MGKDGKGSGLGLTWYNIPTIAGRDCGQIQTATVKIWVKVSINTSVKVCQDVNKDMTQDICQDIIKDMYQDVSQGINKDINQDIIQDVIQEISKDMQSLDLALNPAFPQYETRCVVRLIWYKNIGLSHFCRPLTQHLTHKIIQTASSMDNEHQRC